MKLTSEAEYYAQDKIVCMDPMTAGFKANSGKIYRITLNGDEVMHAIMNDPGEAVERAYKANLMLDDMLLEPRSRIEYSMRKTEDGHEVIMSRNREFYSAVAIYDSHDLAYNEAIRLQHLIDVDNSDWEAAQIFTEATIRQRGKGWEIMLTPEDGVGLHHHEFVPDPEDEATRRANRINHIIHVKTLKGVQTNHDLQAGSAIYAEWAAF